MPVLQLNSEEGLFYEWESPAADGGLTFVFVNAVTGDLGQWEAAVAPGIRAAGHGTLGYNFRGQANSPVKADRPLTADLIVDDLTTLIDKLKPTRPVLVGLSIGGLYAARAVAGGVDAAGLVLLNTLRRMGPRLQWMNEATRRALMTGGPNMMREVLSPLIMGDAFLAANRDQMLAPTPDYVGLEPGSSMARLVDGMVETDWSFDYSQLTLPTLIVTGRQDRVFYDETDVTTLARTIPNGRRVDFPDAGHMLPVEAPDQLVAALIGFGSELNR